MDSAAHAALISAGAALLGSLIGAMAAIGSNVIAERQRRHADMKSTASAFVGEISAFLYMNRVRGYDAYFTGVLQQLKAGVDVQIPRIIGREPDDLPPIAEAFITKIGVLPGDLPERLVRFYSIMAGITHDLARMAEGSISIAGKITIISEDLKLSAESDQLADKLVADLRRLARRRFSRSPAAARVRAAPAGRSRRS